MESRMTVQPFLSNGERSASNDFTQSTVNRLEEWNRIKFGERLWAKDPTLWSDAPAPELEDRLGWLTLPDTMTAMIGELKELADQVRSEGVRHIVLLGMGGSSLAPEVFQRTFGSASDYPTLLVMDSTHPQAVRNTDAIIDPQRTLFVVSSKSGTTIETLSAFYFFWDKVRGSRNDPGQAFVAITDPGTHLEKLAAERGFRRVFSAPSDIGGRYSALSVFGIVPAALIGVDLERLLKNAQDMADRCSPNVQVPDNPGLILGAAIGEIALQGRDKLTFITTPRLAGFPSWIEQLIAESTGKDGKGILPVVDDESEDVAQYGADRAFVYLHLDGDETAVIRNKVEALLKAGYPILEIPFIDVYDLGGEIFRWEIAVAGAGAILGIHPFNQPDVQLAKDLARQAMAQDTDKSEEASDDKNAPVAVSDSASLHDTLASWLETIHTGDYVSIHAYLSPSEENTAALQSVRVKIQNRTGVATTLGYGPRFLHSTGQLHKGGPNSGAFLQIIDDPAADTDVPETDYSFGKLIRAQGDGDSLALDQRGRRLLRVNLGDDVAGDLNLLADTIQKRRS